MGFPQSTLPLRVELLIDDVWTDITDDVRIEDGIEITRGRQDWLSRVSPSRCTLTLGNIDGRYSPRNPSSPYYGLIGRNTQLRVRVDVVQDAFGRSVSNGWGTPDFGPAWTTTGGSASDYSVASGVGRHSVGALNSSRYTLLPPSEPSFDAAVTISTAVLATGADFKAGVTGRVVDDGDYQYSALLQFNPDGTIYLELQRVVGGVTTTVLGTDTTTGLTHVAGTRYRVRLELGGVSLRAKCWLASDPEPDEWNVTAEDDVIVAELTPAQVGCRSMVQTGNTNTLPVVFSFDDFELISSRFTGEVSEWPPVWNKPGTDVWVPLEAQGIMRRLGQGQTPIRSQLRRGIAANTNNVAYWPMEDGSEATAFAEATGGASATLNSAVSPAGGASGLGGSEPLALLSTGARIVGVVPDHTTTAWTFQFVANIQYDSTADTALAEWYTAGNPPTWRLTLGNGADDLILQCYDIDGGLVAAFDLRVDFDDAFGDGDPLFGEWVLITLTAEQNGGNIDYEIWFGQDLSDVVFVSASDAGTVGAIKAYQFGAPAIGADLDGTSIGHVVVRDTATQPADYVHLGLSLENSSTRIRRLADENDIPLHMLVGDGISLGAQLIGELLDVLYDSVDADGGVLFEPRWQTGLAYRPLSDQYNQASSLELDYDQAHIADIAVVDDDQLTRNDVTVIRRSGSSARVTKETGALSVQPPPAGVGRYPDELTLSLFSDDQCVQVAGWRMHVGTWDEARYPAIGVNLAHDPDLILDAASVDIGELITVDNVPSWLPPDLAEAVVHGYREVLGYYDWDITYVCTPNGPFRVIELDDPVLGVVGSAGSELAEDLTTVETAVDVAVTAGQLWTTAPARLPVDINVGGERMTVTAVSGASSPQTFTVTRSVNGVVKTHLTGTPVSLWRPPALAR